MVPRSRLASTGDLCRADRRVTAARALVARFRVLLTELTKFGLVGFLSLFIDLVVFNLALAAMPHKPLTAKVISTVVSATNAYVLNRHWSFRSRTRTHRMRRELGLFMVLNGMGLLIALSCLAVSHYVLGFHGRLADNIAANGIGLVLGTAFRFWSYRRFVWVAPDQVAASRSTTRLTSSCAGPPASQPPSTASATTSGELSPSGASNGPRSTSPHRSRSPSVQATSKARPGRTVTTSES